MRCKINLPRPNLQTFLRMLLVIVSFIVSTRSVKIYVEF